jgi:subtilisin family serine protease
MRTVQGFPDIMAIAARRATALAFVLGLGLASAALAQIPGALSQKSPDAAEIVARVQQMGRVRIIVMFQPPVAPSEVRPDAASIAAVKAQVAAIQDAIIAAHFGSAAAPRPGPGFARGLARFEITPGFAVTVTRAELEALAADPNVASIHYDRAVPPSLVDSVPLIGMPNAYAAGATGAGYAVAVLDTGVQANHEFLAGKVIAEACFSFTEGGGGVPLCPNGTSTQIGAGAADPETPECVNGADQLCAHGTHVAGIAAGFKANPQAGRPPNGVARDGLIWAIQVFTRFNIAQQCAPNPAPCVLASFSNQIIALDHVFANMNSLPGGVRLASVNMSLGGGAFPGTCDTEPQKPAIDRLRNAGVLTVISAGNDGDVAAIGTPACISTAVAVAASTKTDMISLFSNMSAKVELVAPGGAGGGPPFMDPADIQSAVPVVPPSTSAYLFFPGTSMAAPHVAGAIAAIRTVCTSATVDAIAAALRNTGTPITDNRPGGTQTKPRIRVDLAVQNLGCGPVPPPPRTCTLASQLGDFNGDSRSDLLFRNDGNGQISQYLMDGFQVLSAQVIGTVGLEWVLTAAAADFNGDGRADMLFRRTDGTLSMYLLNGPQVLAAQVLGPIGLEWEFAGADDFNGDGRADMLFRRTSDGMLSLYLMNGFQVIAAQLLGAVGSEWRVRGVRDFNGDGRADMLFRHASDGVLSLYLMNGFQVIASQLIGVVGTEWDLVGARDFNGDNRADMLFRRASDGMLSLSLMNGFQLLAAQFIGAVGTDFFLLGLGDLNGDGRSDMVFRRTSDGLISAYLMNGFQVLAAQSLGAVGTEWNACYSQPPLTVSQLSQR